MGLISWMIVGAIAGMLAGWVTPGEQPGGFVVTVLLGTAGASVGGFVVGIPGGTVATGFSPLVDPGGDARRRPLAVRLRVYRPA